MKEKKKQRADDQTVVSFSCSKKLKAALTRAAQEEDRSISNFICRCLKMALEEGNISIEEIEQGAAAMRKLGGRDKRATKKNAV